MSSAFFADPVPALIFYPPHPISIYVPSVEGTSADQGSDYTIKRLMAGDQDYVHLLRGDVHFG
jgi:hypothetical protein